MAEFTIEEYYGKINGMNYWYVLLLEQEQLQTTNEEDVEHYCIMLPMLTTNLMPKASGEAIYCIIESTWMDAEADNHGRPYFKIPETF
jgi:hypothetical protein